MQISKVLSLTEEEFNKLVEAGQLLGAVKKSLEDKDADELSTEVKEIVSALSDVTSSLLTK